MNQDVVVVQIRCIYVGLLLLLLFYLFYDEFDLARAWPQFREVYERAALPINKGGMALRSVKLVFLTAFRSIK